MHVIGIEQEKGKLCVDIVAMQAGLFSVISTGNSVKTPLIHVFSMLATKTTPGASTMDADVN